MRNLQTFSLFSFTVGALAVIYFSPKDGGRLVLHWDWPFILDRATAHSFLKIVKVFWACPKHDFILGGVSTEEIQSQIADINRMSE